MQPTQETSAPPRPDPGTVPARAAGVELLGEVEDSGYRDAPALVRREDGQVLQLTPALYLVLEAIDGSRDHVAVAEHLRSEHGLLIDPEDIAHLVEAKLRPLGVLRGADGAEPEVRRSNPLLALRCRYVVTDPEVTTRLTAPFARLFAPGIVAGVLVAFVVTTAWVLFDQGVAGATRQALYEPHLLLVVFGLSLASAGFHELGHAAACLRGGATPGAMGVGLYLVWPAFYTDVSDSYRLARRARLRVDLGGLYFNAVFSVAVFVAWAVTGAEALLVVIPVQVLQMLRQLVPLVRFDGYHILADLTGVPDLFARIKPTLLGLLPNRWGDPRTKVLKPWARAVVTAWVVLVVPVLLLSTAIMVIALPRLAATAWDSLGAQWTAMASHWSDGRLARAAIGAVAVAAIALPIGGMTYLLGRIARRGLRGVWRATEGNPPRRAAAALVLALALLLVLQAWWPDGQYEPIRAGERGTLVDGLQALAGSDVTAFTAAPAASTEAAPDDPSPTSTARPGAPAAAEAAVAPVEPTLERYRFTPPGAPEGGDNQALAVNYEDGSRLVEVSPSLVWVTEGAVRNTNQAYALASCADCSTVAVAFQVVLIVGSNPEVGPQNEAVAVNRSCRACRTDALAMQTVLTLPDTPTVADRAELARIWERVEALSAAVPTLGLGEVSDRYEALEAEIVALLGAEVAAQDQAADGEASPAAAADPSTTTTTTLAGDGSASTSGDSTTTTTMPATTTSTATDPTTTTTTAPASTTTSGPAP